MYNFILDHIFETSTIILLIILYIIYVIYALMIFGTGDALFPTFLTATLILLVSTISTFITLTFSVITLVIFKFNNASNYTLMWYLILFFIINVIISAVKLSISGDMNKNITYFGITERVVFFNKALQTRLNNHKKWNKDHNNIKEINKYLNFNNNIKTY